MLLELLVLLTLVVVNGLFSGAEIATVTLRKTRIEQLVLEGKRGATSIAQLRANPERLLATVQVGITVISAAAAAYGGERLSARVTPLVAPLLGEYAHSVSFIAVVALVSYLSLVIGELVPKSLALRATETYALLVARPLLALAMLGRPIVWSLTVSSNAVLRIFGDRTSFTEARVSPDELKAMLEEAGEVGSLDPRAGEMASRAIEFSDLVATDVMLPRIHIKALRRDATLKDLKALVRASAHSRFPVFDETLDVITGHVIVRDAFTEGSDDGTIASLVRPVAFVAGAMRAGDVLSELQGRGAELAIVVDEHGGTVGLLTREDLAEELLGATASTPEDPQRQLVKEPNGSAVAPGDALVRELNRELSLRLPESEEWSTVAGLCVARFGRIPVRGERLVVSNVATIEVLDASPRRVRSVRIVPDPPSPPPVPGVRRSRGEVD
ncbi:MAG: hemolysin family protein [Deltaproteobacteria bacterium]|nr:hemolysin family protein [Deltaproteobacteria bacterium]